MRNAMSDNNIMMAIVTTGNGGYDKLEYRAVPIPTPGPGEVLIQVLAAGVNNTDINTRIGWYSSSITASTKLTATNQDNNATQKAEGGWNGSTPFPLIQGTDCCGCVVSTGDRSDCELIGQRVLVCPCIRVNGYSSMENIWMASDFDGAFAQYVKVRSSEVFPVKCSWSDEELATIPCAYGSAENMLHRGQVGFADKILVSGASGGVGSATVQLAKRRGAHVTAITSKTKMDQVLGLGADKVIDRNSDLIAELGEYSMDIVVDNVAGSAFPQMLKILKRGGRYISSGAIAGPLVNLDMRDMYLKDITMIGCTAWDEPVFPNVISYIERNEIHPLVAKVFPLEQIIKAQQEFMEKNHVGKFALVPPKVR